MLVAHCIMVSKFSILLIFPCCVDGSGDGVLAEVPQHAQAEFGHGALDTAAAVPQAAAPSAMTQVISTQAHAARPLAPSGPKEPKLGPGKRPGKTSAQSLRNAIQLQGFAPNHRRALLRLAAARIADLPPCAKKEAVITQLRVSAMTARHCQC